MFNPEPPMMGEKPGAELSHLLLTNTLYFSKSFKLLQLFLKVTKFRCRPGHAWEMRGWALKTGPPLPYF